VVDLKAYRSSSENVGGALLKDGWIQEVTITVRSMILVKYWSYGMGLKSVGTATLGTGRMDAVFYHGSGLERLL